MNADGTNPTRLTNNTNSDSAPCFSPDGGKIAFHTARHGSAEIYIMDANGSNQTRLTNNTSDDSAPCFSPDGSQIAFNTSRNGNVEIYTMNADGANQTRLTSNTATDAEQPRTRVVSVFSASGIGSSALPRSISRR